MNYSTSNLDKFLKWWDGGISIHNHNIRFENVNV